MSRGRSYNQPNLLNRTLIYGTLAGLAILGAWRGAAALGKHSGNVAGAPTATPGISGAYNEELTNGSIVLSADLQSGRTVQWLAADVVCPDPSTNGGKLVIENPFVVNTSEGAAYGYANSVENPSDPIASEAQAHLIPAKDCTESPDYYDQQTGLKGIQQAEFTEPGVMTGNVSTDGGHTYQRANGGALNPVTKQPINASDGQALPIGVESPLS